MNGQEENKRLTESTQSAIRDLILKMTDSKDKAILLILLQMSENIDRNSELTMRVSNKVDEQGKLISNHDGKEQVMLAKVAIAWYILSGVFVICMGIASVWFKSVASDYKELRINVSSNTAAIHDISRDINKIQESISARGYEPYQ